MPNGNKDFDVLELDRFFARIGAVLTGFAQRHSLSIEKYYHQSPSWSFLFRHPKGGVGKLDVERKTADKIGISCCWWYDDYDTATRSLRAEDYGLVQVEPDVVAQHLEKGLCTVLAWRFGDWKETHAGYAAWSKNWTKEQFQNLSAKYPEPIP